MANQHKYTNKLSSTRILIIGGTSGIGYAISEACLEYGALVTISSSSPTRINSSLTTLKTSYPSSAHKIFGVAVNLSNPETLESEIESLFKETIQAMGGEKLDHVIYTAGDALSRMPLSEFSLDKIHKAGLIRFFAPLLIAKYIPLYIKLSPTSSYTITSGSISEKPMKDWSVIGAYAGGHHAMVRNLALDLKPVRVNGVAPGIVDTGLWRLEGKEKEAFLRAAAEGTATGRAGRAEDVAESFLVILKDGNMDGTVIRTDGGVMLM